MIAELRRLDPKPGADADAPEPATRVPDILLRRGPGGEWLLDLNPETLPQVLVNRGFHARAVVGARTRRSGPSLPEHSRRRHLAGEKPRAAGDHHPEGGGRGRAPAGGLPAPWHRPSAPLDPARCGGSGGDARKHRQPRHCRQIHRHPAGVFDLKFFFTTAIAGTAGETRPPKPCATASTELIAARSPDAVLSDDALVARLRAEGKWIHRPPDSGRILARSLRIPSSVQRKREKAAAAPAAGGPRSRKKAVQGRRRMRITVAGKQVETGGERSRARVTETLSAIVAKYFDHALEARADLPARRHGLQRRLLRLRHQPARRPRPDRARRRSLGHDAHRAFEEAAEHVAKRHAPLPPAEERARAQPGPRSGRGRWWEPSAPERCCPPEPEERKLPRRRSRPRAGRRSSPNSRPRSPA